MQQYENTFKIGSREVTVTTESVARRGEYSHALRVTCETTDDENKLADAYDNHGTFVSSALQGILRAEYTNHSRGYVKRSCSSLYVTWKVEKKRKTEAVDYFQFLRTVAVRTRALRDPNGPRLVLGSDAFFQSIAERVYLAFDDVLKRQKQLDEAKRRILEAEHIAQEIRNDAYKKAVEKINYKERLEALEEELRAAHRAEIQAVLDGPPDHTWDNGQPIDPATLRLVAENHENIIRPLRRGRFSGDERSIPFANEAWAVAATVE